MTPDTPHPDADDVDPTRRFERELRHLVAKSFACGATVENTWEITTSATDAPNWRVTIEKTYADGAPAYEPRLLDE